MASKLILMDHTSGEVHVYNYKPKKGHDVEDFIDTKFDSQGNPFVLSNISHMEVPHSEKDPIPIFIH